MTTSSPERNDKAALRSQLIARRDQLTAEERRLACERICSLAVEAMDSLEPPSGGPRGVIAMYAAKGSEVDLSQVDREARLRGWDVAYPRVVTGQRWLAFHRAAPSELVSAGFGLREPSPAALEVPLSELRAFFVPGLGFDESGARLGWGRGYYDSTFARAPHALRFGLAFECQVVERVPRAEHDIPMHELFTEARRRRFST